MLCKPSLCTEKVYETRPICKSIYSHLHNMKVLRVSKACCDCCIIAAYEQTRANIVQVLKVNRSTFHRQKDHDK